MSVKFVNLLSLQSSIQVCLARSLLRWLSVDCLRRFRAEWALSVSMLCANSTLTHCDE